VQRRHVLALPLLAVALPALAGDEAAAVQIPLTAAQIERLLAGNTSIGTWSGSGYSQYFSDGGMTMYVPDGGQPDQGKWRANAGTDQYESWWRMSGWTPYMIVMTNDGYAWVNGDKLEPFKVYEGKQVDW